MLLFLLGGFFGSVLIWTIGIFYAMIWTPHEFENEYGEMEDRTWLQFIERIVMWPWFTLKLYWKLYND